jgi:hypothetical protein
LRRPASQRRKLDRMNRIDRIRRRNACSIC